MAARQHVRFDDGAGYERFMGPWSRLAGEAFLDWLGADSGSSWLDVGCGSGAFTEVILERCEPAALHGIDPSEAQIAYARARPALGVAEFRQGDALALPYPSGTFDVAVMPLVIFFLADPARGVAEMTRVVRQGGTVAAYAWDMPGGGFPYDALLVELRGLGVGVPEPPSAEVSRRDALHRLWTDAGLEGVETHKITVQRAFADFDEYWTTIFDSPSIGPALASMTPDGLAQLEARLRAQLPADAAGRIHCRATANAVRGEKHVNR